MMNKQQCQKGFLSIIAVLLVVVVGLVGAAAAYHAVSDTRQSTNSLNSSQAFYLAQSGIEYAKHIIRNNGATNPCGTNFSNVTLSGFPGAFSVTSAPSGTQCILTSTGYDNSAGSPTAKRTIQAVLTSIGIASAPVTSTGPVLLNGSAVINNLFVTAQSPDYTGSTIISSSTVSFIDNNAKTIVNGLNPSSYRNNIKADIIQNNTAITSANLFSQFFNQPKSQIIAAATTVTNQSALNGASGGTYYANPAFDLTGNATIGTPTNPVIIIANGDLEVRGSVTIYGLLYVTGKPTLKGNATINGAIVSESMIESASGNVSINFNPDILNTLHTINSETVLHFTDDFVSLKEVIP